jgi:hypothetical protein
MSTLPFYTSETKDPTTIGYAERVSVEDAKEVFELGGEIAISEHGWRRQILITDQTPVHTHQTTTWSDLTEQVREGRKVYSSQRLYIVKHNTLQDSSAIDLIANCLTEHENWDADTWQRIEDILECTGRHIPPTADDNELVA